MKKLFTLFFCLLTSVVMFAQAQKVTGAVVDAETGEPLIGVTVMELGTTNGTVTDLDGHFQLMVQPDHKLQLSYVGYASLEMAAKRGNLGLIRMEQASVSLQDVTITGQMARTQQTPVAVSQINALEIEERIAGLEFPYRRSGIPRGAQEHAGRTRQRCWWRLGRLRDLDAWFRQHQRSHHD